MRPGENVELRLDGFAAGGQGVGRVAGRALFVPFTLPGERVSARVVHVGRRKVSGRVEKILEPSPDRVVAPCPVFGKCGGCQLMHASYGRQLELKKTILFDALKSIANYVPASGLEVVAAPEPLAYRNRGQYPVARDISGTLTGFYSARSHEVVAAERCLIHDRRIDEAVACVRAWANRKKVPVYNEKRHSGWLRHVAVRVGTGTGELQLCLVVRDGRRVAHRDLLRRLRRRVPFLSGLVVNVNPAPTNVIFGRESKVLWGQPRLREDFCGLKLELGPQTFFQVNAQQAQRVFSMVTKFMEPLDGALVDAYCGAGVLAMLLAREGHTVIGMESNREAVEDARRAVKDNRIDGVEIIHGRVEKELPRLGGAKPSPCGVVLDPPRKGCAPEVLEALAAGGVSRVAYMSCHPGTLARDLSRLFELGYRLERLEAVDMFPQTAHLEVFAGLCA